ncbi:MAG: DUF2798 domain-containing protein [Nitrososphaera sp.]|jgi:hypothetical protein
MIAKESASKEMSKRNYRRILAVTFRGAVMASITSSIISSSVVAFNVYLQCAGSGDCFQAHFLPIWPRSFALAFAIATPIVLFVAPTVMRKMNGIAPDKSRKATS